ncbi:MAG: hypothetical protein NUK65_03945 [Firmicutes bacterium]|nr:hypothetical protein [Bacillota bacterium]
MVKIKPNKQDAYTTNLMISLLMCFPEIMSIHFDMPKEKAKFTYVLVGSPSKEEFTRFSTLLDESLAAYEELTGEAFKVKAKLQRSKKLNLLLLHSSTSALSLEGIQLMCGIVCNMFPEAVIRDAETLDAIVGEEQIRQEEIIEYLLNHNTGIKEDNLLAFRDAGKVLVYDK